MSVTMEGAPRQVVVEPGPWRLPVVDLEGEADGRERLKGLLREEASRGFDLAQGPLMRAHLYRLAPETHVLLLAMHHIVSDGWSMGVLTRELGELYRGFMQGKPASLPVGEEQTADPLCVHAIHKRTVEEYLKLYAHLFGLRYTIARITNPYGPGQPKGRTAYGVINRLI